MTQGERIREVRKTLGLTLEKFGEKIGIKKNSVSQIENGINNLTEQMTKAICREYHVDYIWLTTGEGDMFVDTDDEFSAKIDEIMEGEDERRKSFIKSFVNAPDADIEALDRLIDTYLSFKSEAQNKNVEVDHEQ